MGNILVENEEFKIVKMEHGESGFWDALGPFFASRDVRKELGIAMSSDENYVWFVALSGDNKVAGFAALECKGSRADCHHLYIVPEFRNRLLFPALFKTREKYAWGKGIRRIIVVSNPATSHWMPNLGYTEKSKRGKYTRWEKCSD